MVGIQTGREQEEREEAEEYRFGGIVIFHITSNADEELRGRGIQARKISSSITRVLARWRGEIGVKECGPATGSALPSPRVYSIRS